MVDRVEVRLYPDLRAIVPEVRYQSATGNLTLLGHVSVPGRLEFNASSAALRLRAANGTLVDEKILTNHRGNVSLDWAAKEAAPGSYAVEFSAAFRDDVSLLETMFVNVTEVVDGAFDLPKGITYGLLESLAQRDLYRIEHTCGSDFTVELVSTTLTDVDFYLASGDPADVGDDPANYTHARNGTGTREVYTWKDAALGTYSLLVAHKATESPYRLSLTGTCGGGGGDSPKRMDNTGDKLID